MNNETIRFPCYASVSIAEAAVRAKRFFLHHHRRAAHVSGSIYSNKLETEAQNDRLADTH
jgi:hypothetical protein